MVNQKENKNPCKAAWISLALHPRFGPSFNKYVLTQSMSLREIFPSSLNMYSRRLESNRSIVTNNRDLKPQKSNIYIHLYIYRERERVRERAWESERETNIEMIAYMWDKWISYIPIKPYLTWAKIPIKPSIRSSLMLSGKSPGGFSKRTWSIRTQRKLSSLDPDWALNFTPMDETTLFI